MISWSGWLYKATADAGSKWQKRLFRVRDNQLEFLQSSASAGPGGAGAGAAEEEDSVHSRGGTGPAAKATTATATTLGRRSSSGSEVLQTGAAADEVEEKPGGGTQLLEDAERGGGGKPVEQNDVAKVVGEAPQGAISLDDVEGFFVLGNGKSDPLVDKHVELCSHRHVGFHQGNIKMLFAGRKGRVLWRLAVESDCVLDIHSFFLTLERSVPRGIVLAAGWMSCPGTLNWNRRYALLLSTGHLLLFKDPTLTNLRREFWLGEPGCEVWLGGSTAAPESSAAAGATASDEATREGEQQMLMDAANKAHQSGKTYSEQVSFRIRHSSISDKKGYLMCLDRATAGEPSSHHVGRFKTWHRLMLDVQRSARDKAEALGTVQGSLAVFAQRAAQLRNTEESRLCLERCLLARKFEPSPSMLALCRAGLPTSMRGHIWAGICKRLETGSDTSDTNSAAEDYPGTLYPQPRHPAFPFPLRKSSSPELLVDILMDRMFPFEKREHVLRHLVRRRADLAVTRELAEMAKFVAQTCRQTSPREAAPEKQNWWQSDALEILQAVVVGGLLPYHVLASSRVTVVDSGGNSSSSSEPLRRSSSLSSLAGGTALDAHTPGILNAPAALSVDVQVLVGLIRDAHPNLDGGRLGAMRAVMTSWLLSAFTHASPLPETVVARVWDAMMMQLRDDDPCAVRDLLIRVGLAVFGFFAPTLEASPNTGEWEEILSQPPASLGRYGAIQLGDWVVFMATRERQSLRTTSWANLKSCRSGLWQFVESEAKVSLVLVNHWIATLESIGDLSLSVRDSLNKINTSPAASDRRALARMVEPVHRELRSFSAALAMSCEAFSFARVSLAHLANRAVQHTASLTLHGLVETSLDEASECNSVRFLPSGQVAINPAVIIEVIRAAISLAWAIAASCGRCIIFADLKTFQSMRMLATCVSSQHSVSLVPGSAASPATSSTASGPSVKQRQAQAPDFRAKSMSASLTGLSSLLRPAGDPRASKHRHVGQRAHDELCSLLHSFLSYLDQLAQCIVDTSVHAQERASSTLTSSSASLSSSDSASPLPPSSYSWQDSNLLDDVFGGDIRRLSELVPFLMRSIQDIRDHAL